jgi:N-formylglutamate amidohydrolase
MKDLDMQIKTLRAAIEYAPDKAMEFVLSLYAELDSAGKAVLRAKFRRYFLDDGKDEEDV